ncbi:MAG: fumarate hydratase class I, partial [Neolewinella sp.]
MSFVHQPVFELGEDDTPYRLITKEGVSSVDAGGRELLRIEPEALRALTFAAIRDISHLFRPGHLQQLRNILDDKEASQNDRFVALQLLKNANVSAGMVLPSCQDTGTAIVLGKKGQNVLTDGDDEAAISEGIARTYLETNLRYSQMAPLDMYSEKNTGNNLPAQIELYAEAGDAYKF